MITPENPRLMIMLGILTLITFGGPIAIGIVLWGGASPNWPPDRPIEWLTVLGLGSVALVLMLAIVIMGASQRQKSLTRETQRHREEKT